MIEASTSEDTGLTEAQAAERFEALLSGKPGDSEGDEPLEEDEDPPQSEDEDDADEADASDEDGSDDDEDDADSAPEPDDNSVHTIKVGDEDVQVTLHELKRGFLRETDYTRKTQAIAEKAKAIEAERAEFAPLAERTKALLEHLEAAYRAPIYDEQELAQLRYENPAEWSARMLEIESRNKQVELILGHKAELAGFDAAEQQRRQTAEAADRAERIEATKAHLRAARPEWADGAKWAKDVAAIENVARDIGLSKEEIDDLVLDPRAIIALDEAAKYRALKAKKPQIQQTIEKVKTAKPGAATQSPSKTTELTRAKQRLAKTGDVRDAALAIERLFK
jgi:hypothetical protein